jgi:hypothetical protein
MSSVKYIQQTCDISHPSFEKKKLLLKLIQNFSYRLTIGLLVLCSCTNRTGQSVMDGLTESLSCVEYIPQLAGWPKLSHRLEEPVDRGSSLWPACQRSIAGLMLRLSISKKKKICCVCRINDGSAAPYFLF